MSVSTLLNEMIDSMGGMMMGARGRRGYWMKTPLPTHPEGGYRCVPPKKSRPRKRTDTTCATCGGYMMGLNLCMKCRRPVHVDGDCCQEALCAACRSGGGCATR